MIDLYVPTEHSKWSKRFMGLANHVAQWSKDPSTKVGSVIVRPDNSVVSMGYNGFPRGVEDYNLNDREYKYARTIHAELNAVLSARTSVEGCHAYVSLCPCSNCAASLVQAGITKVFFNPIPEELMERWGDSFRITFDILSQAGVEYAEVKV